MQLALILAILAALLISENGPAQPVAGGGYRLAIAVAGMGLVALFATVASRVTAARLRRDFERRSTLLRRFKHLRVVHAVLWLATAGAIFCWLDWGQLVRFNWHLNRVFLLDDMLIMLPVVLPMVLSWAAFYEVDHVLRVQTTGFDATESPLATRQQYLALHLRHYLGLLLLPVLGLLAIQDGAELLAPGALQGDYAMAIYGPAFLMLFLFFPILLRYLWKTVPLEPGTLRDRLEAVAQRSGLTVRRILVWQTGGLLVNAAVAGMVAPLRYVFLTDGLLSQLSEGEIETVFGHELGHVRHRHLLLRVLAMIVPISLWLFVQQTTPNVNQQLAEWLARAGLGVQLPMSLCAIAMMGAYMFLVFGFYSRLLEHQADLFACHAIGPEPPSASLETFVSALEKLALASGANRKATGWQHASIARRVEFLRQAAEDPGRARRFHRRLRLASLVVVVLVISPVACAALLG